MIRINLLATPKAKGKRTSVAAPAMMEMGDPISPMLKLVIVLALLAVGNYYYWNQLDKQSKSIAAQLQRAEVKTRELADVKAHYLERQRQADNYKRRVDIIDQLRAGQAGPVNLLNTIGDTINTTEAVWLSTMKDQGQNIDIEGTALSANAVANLIQNLQKTGYFKNIEIKETFQDDTVKDLQAFQFTLTCEKATS
jgi:Tfp pilus assembly protein PilN